VFGIEIEHRVFSKRYAITGGAQEDVTMGKRRWTAFEVAGMTPLGYHDEAPAPKTRKELSKIVCYERWE